jgi:hypothetical protein
MFPLATNSHNQKLIQLYKLIDARDYRLLKKVNNITIMSFLSSFIFSWKMQMTNVCHANLYRLGQHPEDAVVWSYVIIFYHY